VADLILEPVGPFAGHSLPQTIGAASIDAFAWGGLASLMPFRGRGAAVAAALGFALPGPNCSVVAGEVRCLWSGRDAWMLVGPEGLASRLASGLAGLAAVTDQTDAWCGLTLSGADARAVLARLCPLDLDPAVFADGATARTDVSHVAAALLRLGESFAVMVPRSYALHLLHEVEQAMASVAAQREM
jgi:sarcosine oxidase subunit gamma